MSSTEELKDTVSYYFPLLYLRMEVGEFAPQPQKPTATFVVGGFSVYIEFQPESDSQEKRRCDLHFFKVLDKLRTDPLSITPDDARRLSEQVEVTDRRSAKIVSAVNSLAVASQDIKEMGPKLDLGGELASKPSHIQAALVTDLEAAVDKYPHEVSQEVFQKVQGIASSKSYSPFV